MAGEPSYARRELGAELKRLREAAKLTQARIGAACHWSQSKIVRLERGEASLTIHDLHLLADLYRANDEQRAHLVVLMERTEEGRWWEQYDGLVTATMDAFLSHESLASRISVANMSIYPGLLQSRAYTTALFSKSRHVPDPDQAEALVDIRVRRRHVLDAGTQFHAVIGENLLISPVGGYGVLLTQLQHVLDLSHRPNVTVQAVPLLAEEPFTCGGLILLDYTANATSISYLEHSAGIVGYQLPLEVRRHRREFERMRSLAWSPEETQARLETRIQEL
ncbi:helix-turn-helix transcriptional regulator [Yinghuangia aomiensis]|uniref:Helix-turn-helix transcriptional regulator n=1 Tax=Yinghuangia aomiensis TaxID=676205 RepID=A0ABP9HWM6_9ACTN